MPGYPYGLEFVFSRPLSAFLARNHVYGHGAIILCVCPEGVIRNAERTLAMSKLIACAFCIFDPLPSHM